MITGTFGPRPWWVQPFYGLTSTYGWLGWIILVLAGFGAVFVLCALADGVTWLALCIPAVRRRVATPATPARPAVKPDPRDLLRAFVRGASIPELESAALDRARELYGADASLAVAGVENVTTASAPGLFVANVFVRHQPPPAPAAAPAAHEVSA